MRQLSADLAKLTGKSATIQGWLHKKRAMGGLMFVLVRDRTGLTQVVVHDDAEQEKLRGLQIGSVLEVKGEVQKEDRAPGGVEIHDPNIKVLVPVETTPPIEIDKPIDHKPDNLDTLFEHRVLSLRNPKEAAIFKIQAAVGQALHQFFNDNGFLEVHTPKLLTEPTEGGAEVFRLEHFGKTATLAQSPQFYKQMLVGAFERVYEIAPVYRAEPSLTTRHMSEYTSVDAEMGFIDSLDDLTELLSRLLNFVVDQVWQQSSAELEQTGATKPKLTKELPKMTLTELHRAFSKDTGQDTTKEPDPTPAEERWACEYAVKQHNSEAIFITDFPASGMKFYHKAKASDLSLAERTDLLFRGVEIVTASLRENRYDQLIKQLKAIGGDPRSPGFRHFLKGMEFGMPPHGGFGLGLERLTQRLVGLNNVKEATLFPRDMQRLEP